MQNLGEFDLKDFLPYLLNQAAEEASLGFQVLYKERYGMLRTEWRVLFHLGRYGDMTAKEICDRARTHKTKVSRAVAALHTDPPVLHGSRATLRSSSTYVVGEQQAEGEDRSTVGAVH